MDRDLVRRWKSGHDLAASATAAEARNRPEAMRVADLVSLSHTARVLGWATTDEDEIAVVRARFAQLHAKLGAVR